MIFIHPYQLTEKRSGALLKVENDQGIGYADLHPWVELGDPPLMESLKGRGPLLSRALKLASIDREYRQNGIPVDLERVPESHFFLTHLDQLTQAIEEGFQSVKMKVSNLTKELAEVIASSPLKWRLDANGRLSKKEFLSFIKPKQIQSKVEFFEDPYPISEGWERGDVPLAYDRGDRPTFYDFRIVKPALHPWEEIEEDHPIVVTSYLGHPLGQIADAYVATVMKKVVGTGLLAHRIYPKNSFSERLPWKGPKIEHPGGTGFGFDELLETLEWRKI